MSAELQPLDASGFKPVAARDLGAVSQLQWLAVADLVIDRKYQRDLTSESAKRVAGIAAAFEWACFTPVICAPVEGGAYAIIDGQHRTLAAMLVGAKKVPAMVVIADSVAQARAFAAINGVRTKMSPRALFRARLACGDAEAATADRIARECGVTILTGPRSYDRMKPGDCGAVMAVLKALRDYGEPSLRLAFIAAMASKGDKRGICTDAVIRGLALLFSEHPFAETTVRKAFPHVDLRDAENAARRDGCEGLYSDLRTEVWKRLQRLAKAA